MTGCEHVRVDLRPDGRTWRCFRCPTEFVPVSDFLRRVVAAAQQPHKEHGRGQ